MKTALLIPCSLDGKGKYEEMGFILDYYRRIAGWLQLDAIFLSDNGSSIDRIGSLGGTVYGCNDTFFDREIEFVSKSGSWKDEHLKILSFPFLADEGAARWRGLFSAKYLFDRFGYDRVIFLEPGGFVVSKELAVYLSWRDGWMMFPWPGLQIIAGEMAVKKFMEFAAPHYSVYSNRIMAKALPLDGILEGGVDNGNWSDRVQRVTDDFYSQPVVDGSVRFNMKEEHRNVETSEHGNERAGWPEHS